MFFKKKPKARRPDEDSESMEVRRLRQGWHWQAENDADATPIANLMREWFPQLPEEHWETVLNPVRHTVEEAEAFRADMRQYAANLADEGVFDGMEYPDPQERWLRSFYATVLERRLECKAFPSQEDARKRLKEAEDKMASFVAEMLFILRRSVWRDLKASIDVELGQRDVAWKHLRRLVFRYGEDYTWLRTPPGEQALKELGAITEQDYEVLESYPGLFTYYSEDDWPMDVAGADVLTEEGRAHTAARYREFRAEEDACLDQFRKRRFRERLTAKRAQLGSISAQTEEEAFEAATIRGERFERHVAEVFGAEWPEFECQHLGSQKQTERGIDLLYLGPNGERIGVQCKQHADAREPSYREWQSFLGGCTFHQIPEGSRVFVTTGTLTIRQRQEAKKLGVLVFYKEEFAEMAKEHGIEPWT